MRTPAEQGAEKRGATSNRRLRRLSLFGLLSAILIIEGNSSVAGSSGAGGFPGATGVLKVMEQQAEQVYRGGAGLVSGLQLVYQIHSYLSEMERERQGTAAGLPSVPRPTRTCNGATATSGRV